MLREDAKPITCLEIGTKVVGLRPVEQREEIDAAGRPQPNIFFNHPGS